MGNDGPARAERLKREIKALEHDRDARIESEQKHFFAEQKKVNRKLVSLKAKAEKRLGKDISSDKELLKGLSLFERWHFKYLTKKSNEHTDILNLIVQRNHQLLNANATYQQKKEKLFIHNLKADLPKAIKHFFEDIEKLSQKTDIRASRDAVNELARKWAVIESAIRNTDSPIILKQVQVAFQKGMQRNKDFMLTEPLNIESLESTPGISKNKRAQDLVKVSKAKLEYRKEIDAHAKPLMHLINAKMQRQKPLPERPGESQSLQTQQDSRITMTKHYETTTAPRERAQSAPIARVKQDEISPPPRKRSPSKSG